jgi:hypothetical protein
MARHPMALTTGPTHAPAAASYMGSVAAGARVPPMDKANRNVAIDQNVKNRK